MEGVREPLKQIDRLYVLVHPLWRVVPYRDDKESAFQFDQARSKLAKTIEKTMIPRAENEATLFIPLAAKEETRVSMTDGIARHEQWPVLYRRLKTVTAFRKMFF